MNRMKLAFYFFASIAGLVSISANACSSDSGAIERRADDLQDLVAGYSYESREGSIDVEDIGRQMAGRTVIVDQHFVDDTIELASNAITAVLGIFSDNVDGKSFYTFGIQGDY